MAGAGKSAISSGLPGLDPTLVQFRPGSFPTELSSGRALIRRFTERR
jgi:hypothetical protein